MGDALMDGGQGMRDIDGEGTDNDGALADAFPNRRQATEEQAEDPPRNGQGQGCQVEEGQMNNSRFTPRMNTPWNDVFWGAGRQAGRPSYFHCCVLLRLVH